MDILELVLRLAAALSLSAAFGVIAYGFYTHNLVPKTVWVYFFAVVTLKMIWRWFVLSLWFTPDPEGLSAELVPWVQPINQTLYILMGIAIIMLVTTHITARAQHYDRHHNDE